MPRTPSGKTLSLELRLTPPDQREIDNWKINDGDFEKIIVCKEGTPNGTPRLHYHAYVETKRSKSWVRSWVLAVLLGHYNPDEAINGNQLYFSKSPHEHTISYVVKCDDPVVCSGYTPEEYKEYTRLSKEYCKQKERDRKRKQRSVTDEYDEVYAEIQNELDELKHHQMVRDYGLIDTVVRLAIDKIYSRNVRLPTRNMMERYVMEILAKRDQSILRSIYMKSFPAII